MKNRYFLSLLLFWPVLCLGGEGGCASSSRTLLSKEDFAYIAGDIISEGRIVYSTKAQKQMDEYEITENDIKYTLRYPVKVEKNSLDDVTSKYVITGLPDKDGNQLEMWVSFEAQRKGQLTVDSVVPSFMKNKIPLSKAAFMRFINNYLDQKKLIYTIRTRKRMSEQNVNRSDIEHALKNPKKVGDGVAQKHAPGNVVYLRGETANKNLLHLGISLEKQGKIAVTTVGRILNEQIPSSKKDFIRFVSDSIATGKGIVYTRFARKRMDGLALTDEDIKHIFKHPIRIKKKSNGNGYHVLGKAVNGQRPLRLVIAFDEKIIVITVDIF